MQKRSLADLLEFLDYLASKGLMQRNTVSGRKAAVSRVFGVLDPEEQGDVTQVDIDDVMSRFFNLQGKGYKPESLGVYKSRVNSAVNDFKSYLESPATFKPASGGKVGNVSPKGGKNTAVSRQTSGVSISPRIEVHQPSNVNVFPIPIRADVVVRIHGLPFDLSATEAEKIANVIKAMAMPGP